MWVGSQHHPDHPARLAAFALDANAGGTHAGADEAETSLEEDFALLGRTEMAYVKRVAGNNGQDYAAHAAHGTYIWRFADRELACAALRLHDLEPLSLH